MEAFCSHATQRGPHCNKPQKFRWGAWRTGHKEQRELTMADAGSVARSLASRSALKDKPTGVTKIPEALWIDFPGKNRSIWRIRFALEKFEMKMQAEEDWRSLRQQLLHAVRAAVRGVLLRREEGSRKPKPLQISVEGIKLCQKLERKEEHRPDWPKFLATISIETADSEAATAISSSLSSRALRRSFATAASQQLASLGSVAHVRVEQELPQDIELEGGLGEDLFVVGVPEGRITDLGLCEGYELQAVLRKDGCDLCEQGRQLRAMASHDVLAASRVAGPLRLCFQSPFAKLPKFSEKQLANRFGFGKVREQHFHRLVFELQFAWMEFKISSQSDLTQLNEAMSADEDAVICHELKLGGLNLRQGWRLRSLNAQSGLAASDVATFQLQHLPMSLEAGPPREVKNLTLKKLQGALKKAGIHWLQEPEQMILLELLQQEREDAGTDSWMDDLADVFVIDSAGDFKRIGGRELGLQHVFHVSRKIQEALSSKKSATAGMMDMTIKQSDFANILDAGGLNWLTREQVAIIYHSIAGEDQQAGISLNDWISRFKWNPMEAASEVENVLQVWERRLDRRAQLLHRRGNRQKGTFLKPQSLSFWAFHGILTEMAVDWLSLPQQRLLFRSLDSNRDGRIDFEELKALAQRRGQIELLRQERNDAMPGATLAADTEESNSEDEDVDGQDGQDGHAADTGHEGEHGSRDGHSQTDGEGYTEFSGVSPTSAMYEDDFSQVSPDSGALSPSSPSSPLSPGDAAADMALAAVGTARGDATEPSQRSPASPASPPLVSASEAPETPGAEAPEASGRRKRRRRRSMGTTSKIGHKMRK